MSLIGNFCITLIEICIMSLSVYPSTSDKTCDELAVSVKAQRKHF